ncbi:tripartite tricarboxylate transporter substrate-binding protein [Pseudomonas protegens]|uniref:tripartite tricarboxylate transporter substrate-binding protein n=1 Tax=Pseudomonas protegens TaxID=380021 RepID=UPI0035A236AE
MVGFPPGGALDILARVIGQRLTQTLGRPVLVDNQPGAGSLIAAQMVARSQPDNPARSRGCPRLLSSSLPEDVVRSIARPGSRGRSGRFQSGIGSRAHCSRKTLPSSLTMPRPGRALSTTVRCPPARLRIFWA